MRRRELIGGAVALSVIGGLVVAIVTRGDDRVPPGPNTAVAVDPESLDVVHRVRVGDSPIAVAATAGGAWVLNGNDETLSLVDAARGEVVRTVAIPGAPSDVTVDRGALWLLTAGPTSCGSTRSPRGWPNGFRCRVRAGRRRRRRSRRAGSRPPTARCGHRTGPGYGASNRGLRERSSGTPRRCVAHS